MHEERKRMIDKFQKIRTKKGTPFLDMSGGIFTPKTRKKILGITKQPEPGMSANQFWYKRRLQVERALIDLMLFIEVSGKDNINQVITRESLDPLIRSLLWTQLFEEGPDKNQAEIAQLLVEQGFNYLEGMFHSSDPHLPRSSQRTIEEAVDLSKYLVSQVDDCKKADRERREYFSRARMKRS